MVTHLMRMQYMHMSDTDSDIIHMTLIDLYMNNVKLIQGVLVWLRFSIVNRFHIVGDIVDSSCNMILLFEGYEHTCTSIRNNVITMNHD